MKMLFYFSLCLAFHAIDCTADSFKPVKVEIAIIVRSVPVVKETHPIDGIILFDVTMPIVPFNIYYRFAKRFVSLSVFFVSLL